LRSAAFAVVVVAVSVAVVGAFVRLTGTTAPLISVVAIIATAWYGGFGAGAFATVLATALMPLAFPPQLVYQLPSPPDLARLGVLIVVGLSSSYLVGRYRLTREELATTLASIGDGVLVTDADGRVTSINAAAEALTGWSRKEAVGQLVEDVFRIVNEQTRQPAENPVRRVIRDGVVVGLGNHTVLVARDGVERAIHDSGAPVRNAAGDITGAVVVFRDDTARRKAEHRLQRSEARLQALVSASSQIVWSTDAVGNIVEDQPLWRAFTGQTHRQMSGSGWSAAVHPEDRASVDQAWAEALASGRVFDRTFRVRRADGAWRWTLARAVPLVDANGSVVEWIGMSTDVTERRAAEDSLRESEERFRLLADTAPVLIWVNGTGGCEFVNRAYVQFTGFTGEQAAGAGWQDAIHPEDASAYLRTYEDATRTRSTFEAQVRFRRADGEYRWLKSVGLPRVDTGGQLLGFVGCSVDVTDMKRAEEVLRERVRVQDEFLAMLSHELRTPLNAIVGWSRMLLDGEVAEDRAPSGLAAIARNAEALCRLIDDLLDVSRIVSGKLRLELAPVDLASVIAEAIETMRVAADAKQLAIAVQIPPEPLVASGDAARLQQVIWNLLSNAVKFTPKGGRIEVSARPVGSDVEVVVSDSGIGIAPDMLPHVFERFHQGDTSTTRRFGGLGLGLSIARHIVEAHGGTVRAASAGMHAGSCFTISLPLRIGSAVERSAPLEMPAVIESVTPVPLDGLRALLVDDDADARAMVRAALESRGGVVQESDSVDSACAELGRFGPDVVLTDIGLPGRDGFALLEHVLGNGEVLSRVPVVAITAYAGGELERRALNAGFAAFLVKPIEPGKLAQTIRTLVDSH
jgi:PAS domain S-box-containing protein